MNLFSSWADTVSSWPVCASLLLKLDVWNLWGQLSKPSLNQVSRGPSCLMWALQTCADSWPSVINAVCPKDDLKMSDLRFQTVVCGTNLQAHLIDALRGIFMSTTDLLIQGEGEQRGQTSVDGICWENAKTWFQFKALHPTETVWRKWTFLALGVNHAFNRPD